MVTDFKPVLDFTVKAFFFSNNKDNVTVFQFETRNSLFSERVSFMASLPLCSLNIIREGAMIFYPQQKDDSRVITGFFFFQCLFKRNNDGDPVFAELVQLSTRIENIDNKGSETGVLSDYLELIARTCARQGQNLLNVESTETPFRVNTLQANFRVTINTPM